MLERKVNICFLSCLYLHGSYFVHMMELSLMSSDQILAHQALTVKKFWIFHIRKIKVNHIDMKPLGRMDFSGELELFHCGLGTWQQFFRSFFYLFYCKQKHVLTMLPFRPYCILLVWPCSVPTMNLVGAVGSYSRQLAPCACKRADIRVGEVMLNEDLKHYW